MTLHSSSVGGVEERNPASVFHKGNMLGLATQPTRDEQEMDTRKLLLEAAGIDNMPGERRVLFLNPNTAR